MRFWRSLETHPKIYLVLWKLLLLPAEIQSNEACLDYLEGNKDTALKKLKQAIDDLAKLPTKASDEFKWKLQVNLEMVNKPEDDQPSQAPKPEFFILIWRMIWKWVFCVSLEMFVSWWLCFIHLSWSNIAFFKKRPNFTNIQYVSSRL